MSTDTGSDLAGTASVTIAALISHGVWKEFFMSTVLEDRPFTANGVQSAAAATDEAAIRDLFAAILAAWGRGDGQAYGAPFTDDAEYVAFDGSQTRGRTAIAETHQQLFDSWLNGTRLVGQIERVRFLGPDVAHVIATGATLMPGRDDRPVRPSIQTLVAVKRDGAWRFTAFHNCRIVRRNALQWMLFGITTKLFRREAHPGADTTDEQLQPRRNLDDHARVR